MLKKIMNIMNRRPTDNGLKGVPIKKQTSIDGLSSANNTIDSVERSSNDIKLVNSNLDAEHVKNRISFEFHAGKNRGPF